MLTLRTTRARIEDEQMSAVAATPSPVTASCSEEDVPVAAGSSLGDDESGRSSPEGIEVRYVGLPFEYTIPAFTCITIILRQIKFCAIHDGSIKSYDGFIRHNPCIDEEGIYPRTMDVHQSCFVEVITH